MLRRLTQAGWLLTVVCLGGGVWCAHVARPNADVPELLGFLGETLRAAAAQASVRALALAAVFFAAAAAVAQRGRTRSSPLRSSGPTVSPFAILDASVASVVHETLASVSREARAFAQQADPDIVGLLDLLLDGAMRVGASDVHLHPLEQSTQITFRVHGTIEDVVKLPRDTHARLVMRIKVLGRLVTFKSDRPQDGHFNFDAAGASADVRVSIVPSSHGEKVVLRLARSGIEPPALSSLGLPAGLAESYQEMLGRPHGLIFVTGPTGSGKTTTLYSSLGHIQRTRGSTTQIATIEDPIELDVGFLSQTQVNNEVGMTFADGLRSLLRQDPNVIMVGEIRDEETARIAVQAGMSGHLILTTVHAGSAAGVFTRLIEIGVEPFVLASASLASIGQRLVRSLCPYCRVPAVMTPQDAARLDVAGMPSLTGFHSASGCYRCGNTGYLGRSAIYEMVKVTPHIRELINTSVATQTLQEAAVAEGSVPLLKEGLMRAASGVTSIQEVFRVVS